MEDGNLVKENQGKSQVFGKEFFVKQHHQKVFVDKQSLQNKHHLKPLVSVAAKSQDPFVKMITLDERMHGAKLHPNKFKAFTSQTALNQSIVH